MTIAQIEPIAVIFTAPEDQLPDIKAALAAGSPKTIALSTDGKRVLSTGTLSLINNQVDTSSGTVRLKAVFDNKDHALWPGQSVSTRLLIATLKDATVVPDDAVQHGTDGLYAYTVNKENKAELRKIKVARSIDGRSVVDEGLSPGEQVITAGQFKVQPGTLVTTAVASSDQTQAKVDQRMSEGISAPFIRYPIGTSLMMAGILFVGLVAYPLLPVAPLPQVDFPTIQVAASPARRQPGNHGLVGGAAAGAPVRADSRRRADDLDQLPRHGGDHDPVRPQPHHRRRRQRRAGRDQRRRRPVAEKPALAADLSQGQPGRLADPAAVGDLGHAAADRRSSDAVDAQLAQQISQISGVAQVIIGGQQKPAIRIQIDPAKLVAKGLSLEDVRSQIAITTVDSPKGNIDGETRAYTIYANDQLPDSKDWNDVIIAYRNGGPLRIRDIGQAVTGPGGRQAGGLGQRQARRVPGRVQAARRQRHRDRRQDQGDAAAAGGGDPAGDQDRGHQRPHPDHPRRGRGRAVHPAADHRAGRDGDLHLPAQLLGHRHPDRHGAAGAARRLRADVGVRLYARQSVADGADHLRSASWSTTPS